MVVEGSFVVVGARGADEKWVRMRDGRCGGGR